MEEFLTLKNHVYRYIADQINQGKLKPGEKVNENSISEKLKISRTPVREALIQLSSEGLLENAPRKGFVIRHLEVDEAKETYFIIGLLDGQAAHLASPHVSEQQLLDMEIYIGSMDLAIDKGNYTMYYKLQEEFHNIYLNACPNKRLVELLNQEKRKFMKRLYEPEPTSNIKEILFRTNDDHRELVKLFRDKDAAGLDRFLREEHWDPEKAYMETI